MFFDSHAHLTADPVYQDLPRMIKMAQAKQIKGIVNICTDKISLERGLELNLKHDWIVNAAATTPHDVEKEGEHFFPLVEKAAHTHEITAIGETGLDYYYQYAAPKIQRDFLIRYFELACNSSLPVIIHCREAFPDLFAIADTHYPKGDLILHCFTGTIEDAQKALDRGWFISFSGIITFKKSESLRSVVKELPLDRILIETDTPYLTPHPHRRKPNEPSFVPLIAKTIAEVKNLPLAEVAQSTTTNGLRIFRLV